MHEQLQDKLYSLLQDGIEKFPLTKTTRNTNEEQPGINPSAAVIQCQRCSLSMSRKKVMVQNKWLPKKFFVLSEFPESEDEQGQNPNLYSPDSSSGLILKLTEKLNIQNDCHFSFALKCFPEKGIPENALSTCSQHNLKVELECINPEVILCFGPKALLFLAQLIPHKNMESPIENGSIFSLNLIAGKDAKKVFFLSSSRDLRQFPHWRTQVWKFLQPFAMPPTGLNRNE